MPFVYHEMFYKYMVYYDSHLKNTITLLETPILTPNTHVGIHICPFIQSLGS